MNIEEFRDYCLALKGSTESTPFGEDTLVFKVMDKMYALTSIASFESINLKCDPEKAVELRDRYSAVLPGYHMNKMHWNTILINGDMKEEEIKKWILHSYQLVVASLPKKSQLALKELPN